MASQSASTTQQQQQSSHNMVDPGAVVAHQATRARWLFAGDKLRNTPSFHDGFDADKEIKYRQQSATFIQDMAERLNHNVVDKRSRVTNYCICASMIHMHRFYVFHSFKMFDPRDIGAACLFLAGKSEECPRKLEHIVKVWWGLKFPQDAHLDVKSDRYLDASNLIVTYENVILQTIAFDLHVDLPHPHVLNSMQQIAPRGNRSLSETAYWFASDILHLTNWCVRYNAQTLACVCIHMACVFADCEIPNANDGRPWYYFVEPSMTPNQLDQLADEFAAIYKSCKHNVKRLADRKAVSSSAAAAAKQAPPAGGVPPSEVSESQASSSKEVASVTQLEVLPAPPPPPPMQQRKAVDLSQYKIRRNAQQQQQPESSAGASTAHEQPKRNFMPDISKASTDLIANQLPVPPVQNFPHEKRDRVKNQKAHESAEKMKNYKTRDEESRKRELERQRHATESSSKHRRVDGQPLGHNPGPSSSIRPSDKSENQKSRDRLPHYRERSDDKQRPSEKDRDRRRENKYEHERGAAFSRQSEQLLGGQGSVPTPVPPPTAVPAPPILIDWDQTLKQPKSQSRNAQPKEQRRKTDLPSLSSSAQMPRIKSESAALKPKSDGADRALLMGKRKRESGSIVREGDRNGLNGPPTNGSPRGFVPPLPELPPPPPPSIPPPPPPPPETAPNFDEKEDGEID